MRLKIMFLQASLGVLLTTGCAHVEIDKQLTRGNYLEAEKAIAARAEDPEHLDSALLVRSCQAFAQLKKYDALFTCLERLDRNIASGDRRISSLGAFNPDAALFPADIIALPALTRSLAFLETGDYARAFAHGQKAIDAAASMDAGDKFNGWEKRITLRALSVMVMAQVMMGNRQAAQELRKKMEDTGIGFSMGFLVKKEKDYALTKAYMALEEYPQALEYLSGVDPRMMMAHLFSFGIIKVLEDHAFGFTVIPTRFALNHALLETGRFEEAKRGFDDLLQLPATKTNGEIYWAALYDRGRIAERHGDMTRAAAHYSKAIEIIEKQRATIHTEASKIGFVGNKQAVYHRMVAVLYASGQYASAFEYAERAKSRALVDLLSSKKDIAAPTTSADANQLLTALEAAEREEASLSHFQKMAAAGEAGVTGTRSIAVLDRIKNSMPELASLVAVSGASVEEIRNLLAKDETLLEYYLVADDLYAFIVGRQTLHMVKLDGGGLSEQVQRWRTTIQDARAQHFLPLSQALHQRLILPLARYINTGNLTIVPHGVLHYLPFNALFDGHSYLIDRYRVGYLPSAGVLKFLRPGAVDNDQPVLILGNPDLGDPRHDLKHAEDEAKAIANRLSNARVLLRKEASKSRFLAEAPAYNLIHIASHGAFSSDNPLQSALLLAKSDLDDGRLCVEDLYRLQLNAQMVTLSACETALGRLNPGDDVVGLTRGFLYAGAGAVVSSLWSVDDQATALLMTEFYTELQHNDRRTALQKAQLKARGHYAHPFFWSAFQLTGK